MWKPKPGSKPGEKKQDSPQAWCALSSHAPSAKLTHQATTIESVTISKAPLFAKLRIFRD